MNHHFKMTNTYCGKRYGWKERLLGFALGAAPGAGIGLIMFHHPVAEVLLGLAAGAVMSRKYIAWRIAKRKLEFQSQFCDYLDALSASLSCGRNSYESFLAAGEDMRGLYRPDSAICRESERLSDALRTGGRLPELLDHMAEHSACSEVRTFGEIYTVCSKAGGNLKRIVDDTRNMMMEKMAVEEEIQTILTGPKNELNVMAVMPFVILASLRILGGSFLADDGSSLTVNLIALILFAGSYLVGRSMVAIKV